jgi:hypothetical protein
MQMKFWIKPSTHSYKHSKDQQQASPDVAASYLPSKVHGSAIVFKPSTLLNLHRVLIQRKYRRPFSSNRAV